MSELTPREFEALSFFEQRRHIFADLCPHLSPEAQELEAENFDAILRLVDRIATRVASDPVAYEEFKRITKGTRRRIFKESDSPTP